MAERCEKLKEAQEKNKRLSAIEACGDAAATLGEDLLYHRELHPASDSEDDSSDDTDDAWVEQRQLRRRFRDCPPKTLKGLLWSAHQRFFRSLCIAAKVDTAIELAKRAAHEDRHCCVIGLPSIRLLRDNRGGPRGDGSRGGAGDPERARRAGAPPRAGRRARSWATQAWAPLLPFASPVAVLPQVRISGESLLSNGSAFVFFTTSPTTSGTSPNTSSTRSCGG